MQNFRVSQSKVKTWRKCRAAYHHKYVRGIRRKRTARPLMFGKMIHKMIELDANAEDPFAWLDSHDIQNAQMFAAEKAEYGEIIEDCRIIIDEYLKHWDDSDLRYVRKAGRSAEHNFEIEVLPNVIWNGKIDAIGKTGKGNKSLRWMVEHKTFSRKPNADDRWRNLQSSTYFRAIDMMGWKPVDGVLWDYIWSKPPNRPAVLASGKLSHKNIDTLPGAIIEAIERHGFERSEHEKFIESSKQHRAKWFDRIFTPVNEGVRDLVFDDFLTSVKEMVDKHGQVDEMNIDRHCSWCDYQSICRAKLEGLDHEYIEERDFEQETPRDDEEARIHKVSHEEIPEDQKRG